MKILMAFFSLSLALFVFFSLSYMEHKIDPTHTKLSVMHDCNRTAVASVKYHGGRTSEGYLVVSRKD